MEFLDEDEAENPTKEDKMAFRNWRIEARKLKRSNLLETRKQKPAEPEVPLQSKIQTKQSRVKLDAASRDALSAVEEVQFKREDSENQRRLKSDSRKDELRDLIQKEIEDSREVNEILDGKWGEVAALKVPEELQPEIAKQHQAMTKIVMSKNEIVKTLQTDIAVKDEEYMELMIRQEDDIRRMIELMKQQSQTLSEEYEKQIVTIETSFVDERRELLKANMVEMDQEFKKRHDLDDEIITKRQKREDEYYSKSVEVRNRDAEDYNLLKEKLEATIQLLEQELEEMRATYQLNQESLAYYYEVLKERENENLKTAEQQAKKHKRLKDTVSQLAQKFQKKNAAFQAENASLTSEYNRLVLQFQEFQTKFRHFEHVDKAKYRELWAMNEDALMELVRKVLAADRIVHEQILLKPWIPPFAVPGAASDASNAGTTAFASQSDDISGTLVGGLQSLNMGAVPSITSHLPAVDLSQLTAAMLMADGVATARPRASNQSVASAAVAQSLGVDDSKGREDSLKADFSAAASQGRFNPNQVRQVMSALSDQANFLVDARVVEVSDELPQQARILYRVDAILGALGVEDREDLDELVSCFMSEADATLEMHPNDVIPTVKKFAEKRQQFKNSSRVGSVKLDPVASEKKARKKEKERLFWHKLGNVLPESTLRVWDILEKQQRNFNELLKSREKLIEETAGLGRQNDELKMLLQQYMQADINTQLLVPPMLPNLS